jgi:transcriptional regulator with XRE-family HTH domain
MDDVIANYRMKRIYKKIKLKQIADYLNVSSSLICRYEHGLSMSKSNVKLYRYFIDNYKIDNT